MIHWAGGATTLVEFYADLCSAKFFNDTFGFLTELSQGTGETDVNSLFLANHFEYLFLRCTHFLCEMEIWNIDETIFFNLPGILVVLCDWKIALAGGLRTF